MKKIITIVFVLIATIVFAQEKLTTIEVEIHDIDSSNGQVLIGLYNSEELWLKKTYKGAVGKILEGKSIATFVDVPEGIYAISVFHDEDKDGKLKTNFLGIPSEDTGSSNNAPAMFGPPKWEDAKFEVKKNTVKQIINL
ncbi:uncharacterized protein (DUF2141 family) [Maribacter vaceletii]|uniref:Uncharacterized protein (DUF2141 family) n=1 Tax=Maribacter vaceletii TaxID=1206816 RepID=A0A495DTK6_9FLAO|nr:DUF2141 domain-containing protein [Maribacter vaceletii]RKR07900.1 uncharacterized protein (DUF2141 family) [Maribacter vaceletii]